LTLPIAQNDLAALFLWGIQATGILSAVATRLLRRPAWTWYAEWAFRGSFAMLSGIALAAGRSPMVWLSCGVTLCCMVLTVMADFRDQRQRLPE